LQLGYGDVLKELNGIVRGYDEVVLHEHARECARGFGSARNIFKNLSFHLFFKKKRHTCKIILRVLL
jgi:hypothetical protein